MFTSRHEEQLVEIKALATELDSHVRQGRRELRRIRDGYGSHPEPLVAFVHIPKTAGGAVKTMLATAYSPQSITDTGNYVSDPQTALRNVTKQPGAWERWRRRGGRVAIGHTPYGLFRQADLPPDTRYITFLREPVDRVLSHYYRHVHLPGLSDAERATRGQGRRARSLEEALVEMRLPQLSNLCTRFLCSHPTLGVLPPSAVGEAKDNLRTFEFVGLQERFEESMVLLQRTLGLGLVPYRDQHVSGSSDRPSVDQIADDERALIEEHNQLDAELYAFGAELFEEALARAGPDLGAEVERLREVAEGAATEHRDAVEAARVWLDRALRPGAVEPVRALKARAAAAGLPRAALTEARKSLLVALVKDRDGTRCFRRPSGASLTAAAAAEAWLDRELPPGATEARKRLRERGEAAGHTGEALHRARKQLSANKLQGPDGAVVWSRPAKPA